MSEEYKMSEPLTNHNTVFSLQQELETAKRQLEESLKIIEFYGIEIGGKKACEFLNKLKNERGE